MSRRIDVGNGRVWARCPGLPRELGRWVEMPAGYDPATVTEDDLAHDGALRLLTDEEIARAEQTMQNDQNVHAIVANLPDRFDGLDIGWLRTAARLFGERAAEALDVLVARVGGRFPWPGRESAEAMLRVALPSAVASEPAPELEPNLFTPGRPWLPSDSEALEARRRSRR